MSKSRLWSEILPALGATVGAFGCGTMLVWSTPASQYLDPDYCHDTDHGCDIEMGKQEAIWVNAFAFLGCIFSVPFAGFSMGLIGKKWTMIAMGLPFALGVLLITFAKNVPMLFIGRLLYGFSGGAFGLLVPSYTSEIASPSIKGALGSLQQLIVTLGVLCVGVIGKYVEWRLMTGLFLAIPVIMTAWMFFMPESPVFLVTKGRMEDAKSSLLFLRGPEFDVTKELLEIQSTVRESQAVGSISLRSLATHRHYLVPALISMVLMFLQQFSGVNAVLAYAVQLFEDCGITDTIDSYTCNILVCLTQFVFVIVSMLLVDRSVIALYLIYSGASRFGRKILLIVSAVVMGLSMIALASFFVVKSTSDSEDTVKSLSFLPVTATITFIAGFSVGFGPLPWVLNSELFPKEAKALASTIGAMFNWFCAFLIVYFYPMTEKALNKYVCYFFFGAICILGAVFIHFLVPETRGRTEEDMRNYFLEPTEKKPQENKGYE